jgi:hypothetical protein
LGTEGGKGKVRLHSLSKSIGESSKGGARLVSFNTRSHVVASVHDPGAVSGVSLDRGPFTPSDKVGCDMRTGHFVSLYCHLCYAYMGDLGICVHCRVTEVCTHHSREVVHHGPITETAAYDISHEPRATSYENEDLQ